MSIFHKLYKKNNQKTMYKGRRYQSLSRSIVSVTCIAETFCLASSRLLIALGFSWVQFGVLDLLFVTELLSLGPTKS